MKIFKKLSIVLLATIFITLSAVVPITASADSVTEKKAGVNFTIGATPIIGGAAINENDITMYNDKIAVSFAVDTPNPWGNPKGSILDATTITDGKFGKDTVLDVEFLADQWSSWVSSVPEKVYVDKSSTEAKGVVVAERTFVREGKAPINVITTYSLESGSNEIKITTKFENTDKTNSYSNLYSGYTLGNKGGYMFGPYGYNTPDKKTKQITINEPLGQYVTTYNKDYIVALHVENPDKYTGTSGYKDLYQLTTLAPGETKTFNATLQIENSGNQSAILDKAMEVKNQNTGILKGKIDSQGKSISKPVIVVEKEGQYEDTTGYNLAAGTKVKEFQPFTWTVGDENGNYELKLPDGDYKVYAIAENYAPSKKVSIKITSGKEVIQNFSDLEAGGTVKLYAYDKKTGKPVDARIEVQGGTTPVVRYLGTSTFFTDLKNKGCADVILNPNVDYKLKVSSGENFVSTSEERFVNIKPSETKYAGFELDINPALNGWFSADLHHHSNLGDGITPPEDVVKSELSSQLDLLFISDHDAVKNHQDMRDLANLRNVPFIPSLEVSPSWGHFNILNMPSDKSINPNITASEIMKKGHELGGLVISNHPYTSYGYFAADEAGTVPGGYDPNFDLVELQPTMKLSDKDNYEKKTLDRVYKLWNEEIGKDTKKYYLTGGTDTHDVWSDLYSGQIRSFVKVNGKLTADKYLQGLVKGNSYVSMGPLVSPDKMFGDTYYVKKDDTFTVNLKTQAINGIKKVTVISQGSQVTTKEFDGTKNEELVKFDLLPTENTWYSFIIEDNKGKTAVTNPIWVNMKTK